MYANLLNRKWALESNLQDSFMSLILARTSAGRDPYYINPETKAATILAASPKDRQVTGKVDGVNINHNIRLISLDGVMSRSGEFCSYGTEDISQMVNNANNDPSVSAIVLKINSGGGDVDGTEQLGTTLKNSKKPVVAFIAGTGASAAYWVASQCKEIIMESGTTSFVGSIGVLSTHVDSTAALESEGYKVTIIRADGSEDKALWNSVEPLSDTVMAESKAVLNSIRDTFIATVKSGRPKVSDSVFSGKMYDGNTAIKLGLADKVGELNYALGRAAVLAKKQEIATSKNQSNQMNLNALIGEEEASLLSEESRNALETQLLAGASSSARVVELEGVVSANETTIAGLNETIATQSQADSDILSRLEAYEQTGVSAPQVSVLATWYANVKNTSTPVATADVTKDAPKKAVDPITAKAQAYASTRG